MGHVGTGSLRRERCGSRVGEEIQHARLAARRGQALHLAVDEVPVGGLLREDPDVLEGGQAEAQLDVQAVPVGIADEPLVIHRLLAAPGAAVLLAGLAEARAGGEHGVAEFRPFIFGH